MGGKGKIGSWLLGAALSVGLAGAATFPMQPSPSRPSEAASQGQEPAQPNSGTSTAAEENLKADYNAAYARYEEVRAAQDLEAALPHAERAYQLSRQVFGEQSEVSAVLAFNYGLALAEAGDTFQAYTVLDQARERHIALYGAKDFRLASLLGHMGSLAAAEGDGATGLQHFQQALDIVAAEHGSDSLPFATLALHAGMALVQSRPVEARYFLQRSYQLHRDNSGSDDAGTALAAFHLGFLDLESGSFEKAARLFTTALKGFESGPADAREFALFTRIKLVEVYEQLGYSDIATEHCLAVGAQLAEQQQQAMEPLFAPEPEYPAAALARRDEGHVLLRFDVDQEGFVRDLEVLEVRGNREFLKPAVEAARQYRFAPRFENGNPVPAENVEARLNFRLQHSG